MSPKMFEEVSGIGLHMYGYSNTVRPVVSVSKDTIIEKGEGTPEDPYVIGLPKEETKKEEPKEEKPVTNPKTGVMNYIIVFIVLELVVMVPYLLMRKKTMFK